MFFTYFLKCKRNGLWVWVSFMALKQLALGFRRRTHCGLPTAAYAFRELGLCNVDVVSPHHCIALSMRIRWYFVDLDFVAGFSTCWTVLPALLRLAA